MMPLLLTIDDETEFTNLIHGYFGARGFKVIIANSGTQGIKLAKEMHPNVCLIDLKMPGLHGDEVLREILLMDPKIKCIMITASEGEGKTRQTLLDHGAFRCFDKPLSSLRELEAAVKEALVS
jgi:CheY-like chemotaxis protein